MAWSTPPTFADGNILSASQLNTLSDNINYLAALGGLPNVAFTQWYTTSNTDATRYYSMRHRHRYLHFQYKATGGCDYVKIWYNGTLIKNDGDPDAAETYHIDLNPYGFTSGAWYTIQVETAFTSSGTFTLELMWESSSAT